MQLRKATEVSEEPNVVVKVWVDGKQAPKKKYSNAQCISKAERKKEMKKTLLLAITAVLVLLLGVGMGYAHMGSGYGMGPGMMGPGYGYGYGPRYGYGPQSQGPSKPLNKDQAKKEVENYLSSMRNPNLKVGKIEEKGNEYEVDIETKDGSLADKIMVNKDTGSMRSAY